MIAVPPPRGAASRTLLRLADPDHRYTAVRLCSELPLSEEHAAFVRQDGEWRLELATPPVVRLEYELEVLHGDGTRERLCDPANPHRSAGSFGERSVLLLPGYRPPGWLAREGIPGRTEALSVGGRGLGAEVPVRVWAPAGADASTPLPLLVVHDGPDYARLAELTRFAAVAIRSGALPPHRIALLAAGDREEWYSASARYAAALVRDVIPAIRAAVDVRGAPVGMGASLGALAMLHAHRRHPDVFGALFLQSGSFFVQRFDAHEARFRRYTRIVRFVRSTLRGAVEGEPVDVVLTCGSAEENVHNNRLMASALRAHGYGVSFHELPDLHNFTAWRDAFEPHLTRLLARAWR